MCLSSATKLGYPLSLLSILHVKFTLLDYYGRLRTAIAPQMHHNGFIFLFSWFHWYHEVAYHLVGALPTHTKQNSPLFLSVPYIIDHKVMLEALFIRLPVILSHVKLFQLAMCFHDQRLPRAPHTTRYNN